MVKEYVVCFIFVLIAVLLVETVILEVILNGS